MCKEGTEAMILMNPEQKFIPVFLIYSLKVLEDGNSFAIFMFLFVFCSTRN